MVDRPPRALVPALVLGLLVSSLAAAPQRSAGLKTRLASPFLIDPAPEPEGLLVLDYDPAAAYAAFERAHTGGQPFTVAGFALPGGATVDLLLRPFTVLAEGATARVVTAEGEETRVAPATRLFTGTVPGRASRAFLALAPGQVHGYIDLDGERWILSSGGFAAPGHANLARADLLPNAPEPWCTTAPRQTQRPATNGSTASLGTLSLRVADLFLECDHEYRALFAKDQDAIDYAVVLVGAASDVYRRDLGVRLRLPDGYLRLWNTTPPWGRLTTFDDIQAFERWWNAGPDAGLPRALVHALTSPIFGGVASGIGSVCTLGNAYAVSSVNGTFPYPLQHAAKGNWDLFVFAHESGHLMGAQHTFEIGIDCDDGSGPDKGTIMSYCHVDFGVSQVGMRFHPIVQGRIRNQIASKGCFTLVPFAAGDYDADGDHDAADLAELDAYLAQGFASAGSAETFDLDGDGSVDAFDRAALEALLDGDPRARAVPRNGTGLNAPCFTALGTPVLGTTWSSLVAASGSGTATVVLGYDAPASHLLAGGELLVAPPALGGHFLFSSSASSDGKSALHANPIPFDPSLTGLRAYSQAFVSTRHGIEMCNAIDLLLGSH